ncbi:MAG: flavodoxin-dependent (E)-4-hydroxy-3-methylbut-2-enyl-diphosphate synthase [Bacillota bacterium]
MDASKIVFRRRSTKPVRCGSVTIGGNSPISIQTMTNTDTRDIQSTIRQIEECVTAGADIVRVAIPDKKAAEALGTIKKNVSCPIVADIHFDYRLAILALKNGADKVRVNPGNIGGQARLLEVARIAKERGSALRIGINGGSLEKDILDRFGGPTPEAMVESARRSLDLLETNGIDGIVVSLKSSDVQNTIKSYSLLSRHTSWPFHVGITEAGPGLSGVIKSSAGIGSLLSLGLGETIRVSLTGSPVEEVQVARSIIQAMGVGRFGPNLISCPTCGRTQVNLVKVANEVAARLGPIRVPLTVAVMGCPVNGPGEAREADVGLACGRDGGVLFSHGKIIRTVHEDQMVDALLALVKEEVQRRGGQWCE